MQFKRKVLSNGLRLIIVPMTSFESATVMVMVGAGSRYETEHNNGVSHFLEHMAFKGTAKRPTAMEISTVIDGIGGEFNAFTGKEVTGYYIKSSNTHVELLLDLLSDMLQHSKFDQEEINKERGVILEEINMYEDTPMRKIGDLYENLLYGNTPMGWDIAGKKEVIRQIVRQDFVEYMQSLYSSHNITVVVSGGVGVEPTEALVEKYFGRMPRFEIKQALPVEEQQIQSEVLLYEKKTEQVHVALGVRTVPLANEDHYALEVLAAILGGGMSSRLFHEVREKRGLAYYVRTSSEEYTDCGSLVSTAGLDPKRVAEGIKVMVDQYQQIKTTKKITRQELTKAKEYLKGHFVLELEDSRAVAGYYAQQELLEKKLLNPEDVLAKIEAVKFEQVESAAEKYFLGSSLNLALIGNFGDRQQFRDLLKL